MKLLLKDYLRTDILVSYLVGIAVATAAWVTAGLISIIVLALNSMFGSSTCEVFTWSRIADGFSWRLLLLLNISMFVFATVSVLNKYINLRDYVGKYQHHLNAPWLQPLLTRLGVVLTRRWVSITATVLLYTIAALAILAFGGMMYMVITGDMCK